MTSVLSGRGAFLAPALAPLRTGDLDELVIAARADDALRVLHLSAELADVAGHSVADRHLLDRLDGLIAAGGAGTLAAIEILGSLIGADADDRLLALLRGRDALLRRHASWRLGDRSPVAKAIPTLVIELARGGLDTFHAHRTLRRWAEYDPRPILRAVTTSLTTTDSPAPRSRLVDLIGTIEGHGTDELLVDLALDETERESVRIAAIGALGERRSPLIGDTLWALVQDDDLVGAHAALALQTTEPSPTRQRGNGLTVAQLVLAGGLDGQLSRGGRGETGGVASLLVSLGSALGSQPTVDHVVTIGRGSVADALVGPIIEETEPWSYGMIAVGDPDRPVDGAQDAWEHLPAVERGVRRVIRLAGPIDMLHLRMADVGTIAGATVAETAGVPTCFSLAPDPHNVLQSLQSRGELDAASLQRLDTDQHLWFRARLVEGLSRRADRLALFPRATSFRFIDQIDPFDRTGRPRTAVVAEGIDLDAIRRAETDVRRVDPTPAIVRRLNERITGDRRGLPLMVSAGRMHPVKGMERVVAAWASDPWLHTSCNLVIVGGDLDQPSASEQGVLDAIESTLVRHPRARPGLVLLGGQAHADVARLLVSATQGHGDAWAPGGVYVDGALKEEFGLAVLEAMAAGLPVVAPSTGGPSTYVTPGDTGVLVDPDDDLAAAMTGAFRLVGRPGRAERARNLVETRYSIDTMAEQLLTLYLAGAA